MFSSSNKPSSEGTSTQIYQVVGTFVYTFKKIYVSK